MNGELPPGWTQTTLGEIADTALGKMLDRAKRIRGSALPYLRNANVRWDSFDLTQLSQMPFEEHELDRYGLRAGDLLICEGGEPGRAAVWPGGDLPIKYQKAILRVRPRECVNPRWIMYSLRKDAATGGLDQYFTGSTIRHFPQQAARKYELLLPPISEQRRIIAMLERLLAKVDASRRRLDHVQHVLERFRQSVLAAAFSGQLTDDWRAGNASSRETVGDLPIGWKSARVGEVLENLKYGTAQRCDYDKRGVPVLRIPNVANGIIDHSDLKYAKLPSSEREQLRLRAGDILLIRSNGSVSLVGRTALVRQPDEGFAYAGYLIRLRPRPTAVTPAFLNLALGSFDVRLQIELKARSTSGVHNINGEEVRALSIALPPQEEQREIVRRVNALVALADRMERRLADARRQLEKITPALLVKAFRGELVPTEAEQASREGRAEEPASMLPEPPPEAGARGAGPRRKRLA